MINRALPLLVFTICQSRLLFWNFETIALIILARLLVTRMSRKVVKISTLLRQVQTNNLNVLLTHNQLKRKRELLISQSVIF